jgi:hypothetical protein
LFLLPVIIGTIKQRRMRQTTRTCSKHWEVRNAYQNVVGKPERKHSGDLGVDEVMALR